VTGTVYEGRETLRACILHPDTGPEHLEIHEPRTPHRSAPAFLARRDSTREPATAPFACGCRENPDPRVVAVGISNHTAVSPSGRRRIAVSAPSSRPPIGGFNTTESFPDYHA